MRLPYSLTDNELKAYTEEHLQYEVDMLIWTASILKPLVAYRDTGPLPLAFHNGLLNSFSIHARNLVDFLYSHSAKRDYPSDIIIEDYVDETTVSNVLPAIMPLLTNVLKKANKQVAHLTIDRIEYGKSGKEWQFIDVAKHVLGALASIAPSIPSSRMSGALKRKLSSIEILIPVVGISLIDTDAGPAWGIKFTL